MDFFLLFCFLSDLDLSMVATMKRQKKSAGNVVLLENNDAIAAQTEEIQNRIRERAYELSQMRGHAGREMDDWLSAESDVISVPPMHIVEKDGEFQVQVAVPGAEAADIQIMATSAQMLVKCVLKHSHDDTGILHVCDFKSATLFRSFRFPQPIDLGSLEIDLADGMLRITAAKEGQGEGQRPVSRKRSPPRKAATAKGKRGAA
jgi:HSP20 family molecular chaperone IbpA